MIHKPDPPPQEALEHTIAAVRERGAAVMFVVLQEQNGNLSFLSPIDGRSTLRFASGALEAFRELVYQQPQSPIMLVGGVPQPPPNGKAA